MAVKTDNVQVITMTAEEQKAGKYSPITLIKALNAMTQDGLVVLRDVIPVKLVEKLNATMCEETDRRLEDPSQEFNHGVKSISVTDPYGTGLLPMLPIGGTKCIRQPAHKDSGFDHPLFPYYFIANIPLCEFNIENGSTEFWLGSHAHTTYLDQEIGRTPESLLPYKGCKLGQHIPPITQPAKDARMKVRPPIQPNCRPGDIMIRDLRTWHAGMPNSTDKHRIMLGLGFQSPHYPNYTLRLHLPESQRAFFLAHGGDNVEVRAQLYSDEDLEETKADTVFCCDPILNDNNITPR